MRWDSYGGSTIGRTANPAAMEDNPVELTEARALQIGLSPNIGLPWYALQVRSRYERIIGGMLLSKRVRRVSAALPQKEPLVRSHQGVGASVFSGLHILPFRPQQYSYHNRNQPIIQQSVPWPYPDL